MIKIAPSVLAADLANLSAEVEQIRLGGADFVHFDVMDGCFVPNISMGVPVLRSLRKATDLFLDVHLMIDRPLRYVDAFCKAGADLVNFHVEADTEENLLLAIEKARALGRKTGVTLPKVTRVRELADAIHPDCEVEVDGGVDAETAPLCIRAGASVLVAGSSVFGKADRAAAIRALRPQT